MRTRAGALGGGRAEVVRHRRAARLAAGAVIAVVGIVVGGATLPVPGVHLFAPWAVPLLALGVAAYVARVRARVDDVRGPCPACGFAVEERRLGTVAGEALWIRCGACGVPIELVLSEGP